MTPEAIIGRRVLAIGGAERVHFLQNLVTNDVERLADGLVYAAILTPQGKYLADFLLCDAGDHILLDVAETLAEPLAKRLAMYRLRSDVTVAPSNLHVLGGTGPTPDGALPDPRHPALGWRLYSETPGAAPTIDRDAVRVAHCIPETGIELTPDSYILEAGFERLHGVDFRKGCYVGQEVTARMKHKTELKKGLVTVSVSGQAPVGTAITADGRPAGTLFTQAGGRAIAHLRFDRVGGTMQAGSATVSWGP